MTAPQPSPGSPRTRRFLRAAAWLLLAAVIAVSFAGYLGTDLQMQWENIAALCGF